MRFIIYIFDRLWARTVWTTRVTYTLSWHNLKLFFYKKKLSYISVQFSLWRLTYHNNYTNLYSTQNMILCKTKFFTSNVAARNCSSENRKIVCLFKSLMRWRVHSTWWDDVFFVKLNESLSSDLMRWRFHLSSLMNRFRQIRWIAHNDFDEMFRQI